MSKKKDAGYHVAVSGAKGILRILLYILVVIAIIYVGKTAYSFGYAVFNQVPVAAKGQGQDITVVVKEEDSVKDVAKTLKRKGVIADDTIFRVQEYLSDYHEQIKPGTYILNTEQTTEEILAILSQENTAGQPTILNQEDDSQEGQKEDGEQS